MHKIRKIKSIFLHSIKKIQRLEYFFKLKFNNFWSCVNYYFTFSSKYLKKSTFNRLNVIIIPTCLFLVLENV